MSSPLRTRRDPCALHGLAVADDGQCVRCRRDDDQGGGLGWPALLLLGCCAAGLLGWQAAKMGPDALSLRPQHHLAVVSLQATTPVEQLHREQREDSRSGLLVRPEPVAPAYAPGAVEVTITEAEQEAFLAPAPAPVTVYGSYDAHEPPPPTKIIVEIAPPKPVADLPVFRGRGPADAPGGGNRRHRPAIPKRPVLLPPPGGSFPGGGTGELWNPRGSGADAARDPARPAPRAARRSPPRPRSDGGGRPPIMRGASRATSGARPPVGRSARRR